ncbi:MAG: peptidoglycan-associated lipoprotein Pal [Chlorobiaceae bacterium]
MKRNSIIVLALMVTAGCSSKSAVTPDTGTTSQAPSAPVPSSPTGYGFDQWQTGPLGDVFFEFDSSTLSADGQEQLKQNGIYLESNALKKAIVEGHCDERGTSEYNLALGDRRAVSAKEFLVRYGVSPSRLETVSFGEERPFALGHDEEAWAKNRRAHFVLK